MSFVDYVEEKKSERIDIMLCCRVDYNNDRDKNCIVSNIHNNNNVFEIVGGVDNSFLVVDAVRVDEGRIAETRYYETVEQCEMNMTRIL